MTLHLVASGTRPWSSAWRRSGMLGNMVVPPDITTLPRRSLRTSRSQSLTVLRVSSWRPIISLPSREGLNMSSGQRIIWLCTVTTVPSGISNCFSFEGRLEHELRATDHLVVHGDDGTVGHLELLLLAGEVVDLISEGHGDVAKVLLDLLGGLTLSSGGEGDLGLLEDLADVVGQVATSKVDTLDGVRHGVTLVDGHGVGHTITAIHHDTSGTARGVQGEHSLDGDVEATDVEGLEHDLGHALTVVLGA